VVDVNKLSEIKAMRRNLGLTQSELAKLSGVSQSLIARIESGRVDPTYSKVGNIFDALEKIEMPNELTASNLMKRHVISVSSNESVIKAAGIMKKYNISQLPVIDKSSVVGLINERDIFHSVSEKPRTVKDIMEDAPPIISTNTPLDVVTHLLDYNYAVLVSDNGKIKGIVTRANLLKLVKR
jgi:predicted transcriptional regulator